jgi:hypothetical protein
MVPNSLQAFFSLSGRLRPAGSTRHSGHWLANCTCPGWLWWWRIWWNEDWQGNRSTRRNRSQRHFDHHRSHLTRPGIEPGPSRWESLQAYSISSPMAALVMSVFSLTFLPRGWVLTMITQTVPASPILRLFVSSGSLLRCDSVQVYHHHVSFPIGGQCPYSHVS